MILPEIEAKEKLCVFFLLGAVDRMHNDRFKEDVKCLVSNCMAYWRWENVDHMRGYCSLGGKPIEIV